MSASLDVDGVTVDFQGLRAIEKVSLSLAPGEILGLIGPNGAGKTTLVNVLTGFQTPTEGRVRLAGTDITLWPAFKRSRAGLARTFQSVLLFKGLSVMENIEAGAVAVGLDRRSGAQARPRHHRMAGPGRRGRAGRRHACPSAASAGSASAAPSPCGPPSC